MKDSYCAYCGSAMPQTLYPKICATCKNTAYDSATVVCVGVVPINGGLLGVRRAIEPRKGVIALPGGYKERTETWEAAIARELLEETGVIVDANSITLMAVRNATNGSVLLFGQCAPVVIPEPIAFRCEETEEVVVMRSPMELAFPHHTDVAQIFWDRVA